VTWLLPLNFIQLDNYRNKLVFLPCLPGPKPNKGDKKRKLLLDSRKKIKSHILLPSCLQYNSNLITWAGQVIRHALAFGSQTRHLL
jgi:hypothetical protein